MEEKKNKIYLKLSKIQDEIKVPKSLKNKFGNYNYRNAEQILKEVKAIALKYNCVVKIDDNITMIGNRYYVCSEVALIDLEDESSPWIVSHGWARESENKTGMDASQITGAATSYARKYALGALFGIDDGFDADSMDNREESKPQPKEDPLANVKKIIDECETLDELKQWWGSISKELKANDDIRAYVGKKQKQLMDAKQQ